MGDEIRIIETEIHRLAWVGRIQTTCHRQGHLPLGQVAESPVQPGLEPSNE